VIFSDDLRLIANHPHIASCDRGRPALANDSRTSDNRIAIDEAGHLHTIEIMDRRGIPKRIRGLHVGQSSSSAELSDREIVARIRKRRIALGLAFLAPIDLPAESGGLLARPIHEGPASPRKMQY
jgi:hypothetical protein